MYLVKCYYLASVVSLTCAFHNSYHHFDSLRQRIPDQTESGRKNSLRSASSFWPSESGDDWLIKAVALCSIAIGTMNEMRRNRRYIVAMLIGTKNQLQKGMIEQMKILLA